MKILGIYSSLSDNGITKKMLLEVLKQVDSKNEIEIINVSNVTEQQLDKIESKMEESDVWIFSTPVYWGSMCGMMKTFLDRMRRRLTITDSIGNLHYRNFKNKHYILLTNCYTSALENMLIGVTDSTLRIFDKVLTTAGLIKIDEVVCCGTWNKRKFSDKKLRDLANVGKKINNSFRRDDQTLRRYLELFGIVAVLTLVTMFFEKNIFEIFNINNEFITYYVGFVLIFYFLLAIILHFLTVVKHRRH